MALWQFVCNLVPLSAARVDGMIAARMSRNQLDAVKLSFSQSAASAIFECLEQMLPEKQSWCSSLRIWGDEQTDDVQIGFRDGEIEDVQFRLNVANLRLPLVGGVCLLARDFECVFATRGGAIFRPYSESFMRAILKSDAARYVKDPRRYLLEFVQADPEIM